MYSTRPAIEALKFRVDTSAMGSWRMPSPFLVLTRQAAS